MIEASIFRLFGGSLEDDTASRATGADQIAEMYSNAQVVAIANILRKQPEHDDCEKLFLFRGTHVRRIWVVVVVVVVVFSSFGWVEGHLYQKSFACVVQWIKSDDLKLLPRMCRRRGLGQCR